MDFLVLLLFVAGLGAAFYLTGLYYQKIEYLKLFAVSVSGYFSLFVVISGLIFWMDAWGVIYQIEYALTAELIALAVLAGLLAWKRKQFRFSLYWKKRPIILYVLILAGFLVSLQKYEFFGMGQDEGVYQTVAIVLASGNGTRQFSWEEVEFLPEEMLKEADSIVHKALPGYDPFAINYPFIEEANRASAVTGIFHGIRTVPALLELFTRMFGISNMQQVQSLFYLCMAVFVLLVTESLSLSVQNQVLSVSIAALSPIIQWVMKSALAEGLLCVLYAGVLFALLDTERRSRWLAVLYISCFAFFHVTIFVMAPFFFILFLALYFAEGDRTYLLIDGVSMLIICIGLTAMGYLSPVYTFNNITLSLTFFSKIGGFYAVLPVFWSCFLISILILFLAWRIQREKITGVFKENKTAPVVMRGVMLFTLLMTILRGVQILNGDVNRVSASLTSLQLLTLVMFAYGTGIFAFCVMLVFIFCRPSVLLESRDSLVIAVSFFYCVLITSAFLKREIFYTYYYSRYIAPWVVICALAAGFFLNALPTRFVKVLTVAGVIFLLPFDWVLATQKDDSRVPWDVLKNGIASIDGTMGGNAVVLDGGKMLQLYGIPLKAAGVDVYPMLSDYETQMQFLSSRYDTVCLIAENSLNLSGEGRYTQIFRNEFMSTDEDRGERGRLPFAPFPVRFFEHKESVSIYRYHGSQQTYDFGINTVDTSGMWGIENDSYRWLRDSGAGFVAYLDKQNYEMRITTGPLIDLNHYDFDSYTVDVLVNQVKVGSLAITEDTSGNQFGVLVPEELVLNGANAITFEAEPWSPSDYGSNDTRSLTISLSQVEFVPVDLNAPVVLDFGEDEGFSFSGFSGNEQTFRWIDSQNAEVTAQKFWADSDYLCTLYIYGMPDYCFRNGDYPVHITVDHDLTQERWIAQGDSEVSFVIDRSYFEDGAISLTIDSELWSPSDYGSDDTRTLGIGIDKIVFEMQRESGEDKTEETATSDDREEAVSSDADVTYEDIPALYGV